MHVQDHDYFIPTKFGQHPSIGSVRKAMCSHTYTCISDPPPQHGKYTKEMQIKHLIAYKSIEIALKYTKMTNKHVKKFDFRMENQK